MDRIFKSTSPAKQEKYVELSLIFILSLFTDTLRYKDGTKLVLCTLSSGESYNLYKELEEYSLALKQSFENFYYHDIILVKKHMAQMKQVLKANDKKILDMGAMEFIAKSIAYKYAIAQFRSTPKQKI